MVTGTVSGPDRLNAIPAAAAAGANLLGGFFPTVGSLIGSSPDPGEGSVADIGPDGAGLDAAMRRFDWRTVIGDYDDRLEALVRRSRN